MYYYDGIIVIKDINQAIKWYEKATNKGHKDSEYKLACMYEDGCGVEKDYVKAVELYISSVDSVLPWRRTKYADICKEKIR